MRTGRVSQPVRAVCGIGGFLNSQLCSRAAVRDVYSPILWGFLGQLSGAVVRTVPSQQEGFHLNPWPLLSRVCMGFFCISVSAQMVLYLTMWPCNELFYCPGCHLVIARWQMGQTLSEPLQRLFCVCIFSFTFFSMPFWIIVIARAA